MPPCHRNGAWLMQGVVVMSTSLNWRSMRSFTAGIVVAVASTFALVAMARPGPGPGGPGEMGLWSGRHLERMLGSVNATPEQRDQIKQITQAAAADLKAQHQAGRELRERSLQLFTQPTVDANAVEALRQQMLQQHDQTSRRVSQAMLDISRVLTPEQRTQLASQLQKRGEAMRRHMQERQHHRAPAGGAPGSEPTS